MQKKPSNAGAHFEAMFGVRQSEQIISGFKLIPHDKIERGSQPRQSFPQEEIDELANSISALRERGEGIEGTGILQPLLVTEKGSGYRLVAGERRYRASAQAGVKQLPAVIVSADEKGVLLAQIVENLQRRDLPALEEARGLDLLMKEQKLSLREAAHAVGKGKGYVENRINLLKMGADVQEMVSVRTDSLLHARDIDAIGDLKLRAELIRAVLEDSLSRSDLRRRIEDLSTRGTRNGGSSKVAAGEKTPEGRGELSVQTDNGTAESSNGPPADPLESALRPAVAFTREFGRQIKSREVTAEYCQVVADQLQRLRREIDGIERNMKKKLSTR
jgi:ParB family chromosome partitioning protein